MTYILVSTDANGNLTPASNPRTYKTKEQAKAVALSMAEKNKGVDFFVFKAVAKAAVPVAPPTYVEL